MEISKEEIKHLANLSALEFNDEEIDNFQKEFNQILDFVNKINNAKVDGDIEYNVHDFSELREDKVKPSLSQEEVLANAPQAKLGSFVVPLMME